MVKKTLKARGTPAPETRFDRSLRAIKDHPMLASLLLVGVGLGAVLALVTGAGDAASKVRAAAEAWRGLRDAQPSLVLTGFTDDGVGDPTGVPRLVTGGRTLPTSYSAFAAGEWAKVGGLGTFLRGTQPPFPEARGLLPSTLAFILLNAGGYNGAPVTLRDVELTAHVAALPQPGASERWVVVEHHVPHYAPDIPLERADVVLREGRHTYPLNFPPTHDSVVAPNRLKLEPGDESFYLVDLDLHRCGVFRLQLDLTVSFSVTNQSQTYVDRLRFPSILDIVVVRPQDKQVSSYYYVDIGELLDSAGAEKPWSTETSCK